MGAGHSHAPATGHAGGRYRRRLAGAFALTAGFFLIELVAGLVSGSLALLSDAGHMAADVVVLGAALLATRIASRPDSTGRRTYGSYRAEVFASALAVLAMLAVGVYVVVEAISRLGDAPESDGAGYVSSRRPLRQGEIVTARIERADEYDLHGTVAGF